VHAYVLRQNVTQMSRIRNTKTDNFMTELDTCSVFILHIITTYLQHVSDSAKNTLARFAKVFYFTRVNTCSISTALTGCQTIDKVGQFCLPIKSANNLSSIMQRLADFIVQFSNVEHDILDDKIGQLFGYWSPWRLLAVGDKYLFCLVCYSITFIFIH